MKFVFQKQKNDCVIAAIATITQKSYSEVRKTCGPPGRGLEFHEILWLINHWGTWRMKTPRSNCGLEKWAVKHPCSLVIVGDALHNLGHAIAIVQGTIFDPSGDELVLESLVGTSFVPKKD